MADVVYVVDQGLQIGVDNLLKTAIGEKPRWVGWGTDGTAAEKVDTTLGAEAPEARADTEAGANTRTQEDTATTGDTLQCVATLTAGAARAIQEVGWYAHETDEAGYLYLHGTFDVINLTTGDSIEFTIDAVYNQL